MTPPSPINIFAQSELKLKSLFVGGGGGGGGKKKIKIKNLKN
jgi:hypothetical protein